MQKFKEELAWMNLKNLMNFDPSAQNSQKFAL